MKHRYFRFRLRDLLWLMLVCAVMASWWQNHRRLRSAQDEILSLKAQTMVLRDELAVQSIGAESARQTYRDLKIKIEVRRQEALNEYAKSWH